MANQNFHLWSGTTCSICIFAVCSLGTDSNLIFYDNSKQEEVLYSSKISDNCIRERIFSFLNSVLSSRTHTLAPQHAFQALIISPHTSQIRFLAFDFLLKLFFDIYVTKLPFISYRLSFVSLRISETVSFSLMIYVSHSFLFQSCKTFCITEV